MKMEIVGFVFLPSAIIGFFKFSMFMSGMTITYLIIVDLAKNDVIPLEKVFSKVGKMLNKANMVSRYPLNEGHTVVLGMTRHGKTFATMQTFKNVKEGVFFFNVQQEDTPKEYMKADKNVSFSQIDRVLKNGGKVNYIPSTDLEEMQKEIEVIIKGLYDGTKRNIYFIVDECHLIKKKSLEQLQRIATTGLRFGIKGVFCSQRGALIDNTLISQSTCFIWFYNNQQDQSYWRNYGVPIDELMGKIGGEKYLFCTYDGKEIKGAYQIKI